MIDSLKDNWLVWIAAIVAASFVVVSLVPAAGTQPMITAAGALLLFVLALMFAAVKTSPSERVRTSGTSALYGAIAILLTVRPWVGGIPAFAHDWKWPIDALQFAKLPDQLASLWQPWGSGGPAIQLLGNYPITISAWIFGKIVPPSWALLALLLLLGSLGGYAAARACAALGLAAAYQLIAAFCYPMMPAAFNRFSAGHLSWILGYMVLPAAIAAAAWSCVE